MCVCVWGGGGGGGGGGSLASLTLPLNLPLLAIYERVAKIGILLSVSNMKEKGH